MNYTKPLFDYITWFEQKSETLPSDSISRIVASITDHATFWLNRQELTLQEYSTILDRLKKNTPTRSHG